MQISHCAIIAKEGDITQEDTEGIVNAANSNLSGGGGVDGAIHRVGGPAILAECKEIIRICGKCPTGHAVITNAGFLKAKKVIHTVGPVWEGGFQDEDLLLSSAYQKSLEIAFENTLSSLSFPAISTGIYGFPIKKAAPIAIHTCKRFLEANTQTRLKELRFILYSTKDLKIYQEILADL